MLLVWISKPVFHKLRRKQYTCLHFIVFHLVFIAVTVSTHLYVLCHHFIIRLMSLFQGHLACQNFTPTKPHPGKVTVKEGKLYMIRRYPGGQFCLY